MIRVSPTRLPRHGTNQALEILILQGVMDIKLYIYNQFTTF